eukprot:CAMPEP_0195288920 /NCGR_PEP_ID=MMETSP0707-20130614/5395_1 /TAXON_ID=33640 /ORGANISM="Asterionellopsis glacialis, Strain CCMP134" /LENGTH=430 /DNA_ID=CAMNT_0040348851 /DNA_START=99 /DNA_END=1391 /DNA_ORIENTATION=-
MLVSAKSSSSDWIPSKSGSRSSSDDDTSIVDVFQSILSCSFNDYAVEAGGGVTSDTNDTSGCDCSTSLLLPSCGTSSSYSALHEEEEGHNQSLVDPYEMLQIRVDASPSEIREAYRKLSLWHHPQRCVKHHQLGSPELAERYHVFQLLAASYETLIDTETRTRYNYIRRVEQRKARQRRKQQQQENTITLSQQQPHMRSWYPRKKVVPLPLNEINDTSLVDDLEEDWMDSDCDSSHTSDSNTTTTSSTDYHFLETHSSTSQQHQGGPLSSLLKARNYQPFTDPLMIFRKVFETDLFIHTTTASSPPPSLISNETALVSSSLTNNHNNNTSLYQKIPKSPPRSAAWTGSRTIEQNGVTLSTTTRIRSNRKITRTERTTIDPSTGKKHTHISVLSEEVDTKFANVSQRSPKCCGSDTSASWYVQCCEPLLCL